jgi:hypothetical protein
MVRLVILKQNLVDVRNKLKINLLLHLHLSVSSVIIKTAVVWGLLVCGLVFIIIQLINFGLLSVFHKENEACDILCLHHILLRLFF